MVDVYNVYGVIYEVGDNEFDVKICYVVCYVVKMFIDVLFDIKVEDFVFNICLVESC